jgi:predicted Zn-dependent protease
VNDQLPVEQQKALDRVQGYIELEMPKEALRELRELPAPLRDLPFAVELMVVVLIRLQRWKPAATQARKLCRLQPNSPVGYIHLAYCQHECGQTAEAHATLLRGPSSLHKEATYFYNLACYEAVLGDLESARLHLARCISINKRYLEFARTDSDLAALHPELPRHA